MFDQAPEAQRAHRRPFRDLLVAQSPNSEAEEAAATGQCLQQVGPLPVSDLRHVVVLSGEELAGRLGVSPRTLRRDVDRLRELGYPVQARRGAEGGYQLAPGASLPPLVLDDDEAVVLATSLLTAAQGPVAGTAETAVRALSKVIQVMPARLRRRVDAVRSATEQATWTPTAANIDPETLTTIALACRDTERVTFGYAAADGTRTERQAEPHRLVSLGRRWYLVAYDLTRHDWRTFRLDRIAAPRATGGRFAPRPMPAGDAAAFVRAGIAQVPRPYTVKAVIEAPAAEIRARVGRWATIKERTGTSCEVQLSTDSLDWAAFALAITEASFQVLGPPEFAEHLRTWSGRFARAITHKDFQET